MSDTETGLHLRTVWLLIGWGLIVFSIVVSLNNHGLSVISGNVNDKLIHMTGYAGLMLWFSQLYHAAKPRFVTAVLLIVMGIVLEFLQGLGGTRVFEVADMIANAAGVAAGGLLALTGLDRILSWFERRVIYR